MNGLILVDTRHRGTGHDLGAGPCRESGQSGGVGGAGERTLEVSNSVTLVVAVPRNATAMGLTLNDHHPSRDEGGEFARGRQTSRAAAHDDNVNGRHESSPVKTLGLTPVASAIMATTCAAQ